MDNKKKITEQELKKEKTFTKSQVTWIALTTAAAVVFGSYAIQKANFRSAVPNSITIDKENQKNLAPNMAFDPNSNQEMINRISDVYVDALTKGINNISIEQWVDFYTVLNINDIEPSDYARLQFATKTKESIIRNFDFVANTLLDDTITSTPSTIVDIASLVADKDSASAVEKLQEKIAIFNTSNSKSTVAGELNKFVENEFATENYKSTDAASNLVRFKLLLAMERMTINNNYRVPTASMSKIIFGTGENCNLESKSTANTKYNGEKTNVKEMLTAKLEEAKNIKSNNDGVSAIELLTGLEIEMKIQEKIDLLNAKYVPNPSLEQAIIDNKPKTGTSNDKKVQSTDKIVTDKNTGEKFIAVDPTEKEKQEQQKKIEEQLKKENQNEELRVAGVLAGSQMGYDNGLNDGYKGYSYNDKGYRTVTGDKIFVDAFKQSYTTQYKVGYSDGEKKLEREKGTKVVDLRAEGLKDGGQKGYDKGFTDGYKGYSYSDSFGSVSGEKKYRDAYIEGFKAQYKVGYAEGQKKRQNENKVVDLRAEGLKDGGQKGYDKGLTDGYKGYTYNDNYGSVSGEKKYRDAYIEGFKAQYKIGYAEGQKKLENEKSSSKTNEQLRLDGIRDGKKSGYADGYADGYNGARYNDNFGAISGDKVYRDAFTKSYTENYSTGYYDGKKQLNRELNNNTNYNTNYNSNTSIQNQNDGINERYEAAPGYHYDDKGRLIDDSTGLEVKTTSSREKTIEELKNLRVVAVSIKNTDITISEGGKKI
jgi:hypothetical protein